MCGSTEHPAPAPFSSETVTRQQLDEKEAQQREMADLLYTQGQNLEYLRGNVESCEKQMEEAGVPRGTAKEEIRSRGEAVRAQINDIVKRKDEADKASRDAAEAKASASALLEQAGARLEKAQEDAAEKGRLFAEALVTGASRV